MTAESIPASASIVDRAPVQLVGILGPLGAAALVLGLRETRVAAGATELAGQTDAAAVRAVPSHGPSGALGGGLTPGQGIAFEVTDGAAVPVPVRIDEQAGRPWR